MSLVHMVGLALILAALGAIGLMWGKEAQCHGICVSAICYSSSTCSGDCVCLRSGTDAGECVSLGRAGDGWEVLP